jgi:hypothetical protein
MATVIVSITLKKQAVPANPPAASAIRYQLLKDGALVEHAFVALPDVQATFLNVADGTYTVMAQRLNNLNTPVGDAAESAPFTVVNTTEIDVPDVVSVTI